MPTNILKKKMAHFWPIKLQGICLFRQPLCLGQLNESYYKSPRSLWWASIFPLDDTDTDKQITAQRSSRTACTISLDYVWTPVTPANPCASLLNQSSQHAPKVVLWEGVTQQGNSQQLIESARITSGPWYTRSISTMCAKSTNMRRTL